MLSAIARRVGLTLASTVALLLVACGSAGPDPTPTPTFTATASPTATVLPTPRPTSTPYTVIEPPASGRIRTTFSVSCDLGALGPEIHVGYDVEIQNTDNPEATLTRVRLYIDGVLREDTGPMSTRAFVRQSTFDGVVRKLQSVQIHISTWAAPRPADIVQFVQCPPAPDKPVT